MEDKIKALINVSGSAHAPRKTCGAQFQLLNIRKGDIHFNLIYSQ